MGGKAAATRCSLERPAPTEVSDEPQERGTWDGSEDADIHGQLGALVCPALTNCVVLRML